MLEPSRELSDSVLLDEVRLPTRIKNVLSIFGFKTVGDVRSASEKALLGLPDLGRKSVAHIRESFGLDSRT